MKLFTIGDSVSQGFMSLAAARTDLSYSTQSRDRRSNGHDRTASGRASALFMRQIAPKTMVTGVTGDFTALAPMF